MALLTLQEQALDERALVQLGQISEQHKRLPSTQVNDGARYERQARLDEEDTL